MITFIRSQRGANLMRRRSGFTLVELLVTMALVIMMMAILASAFQSGLSSVQSLKAIGNMNDQLRTAAGLIRSDLAADHFEGAVRLSDQTFGNPYRPVNGFFRVYQSAAGGAETSTDPIPSYAAPLTGGMNALHMTVKRRGNQPSDFFGALVPSGSALSGTNTTWFSQPLDARYQTAGSGTQFVYRCQWGEIAYFINPLQYRTANGTQLYSLHRMIKVLVVNNSNLGAANPANQFTAMSLNPTTSNFNSPPDLGSDSTAKVANRNIDPTIVGTTATPNPNASTDNMILSDVVAFDVKILPNTGAAVGFPFNTSNGADPFVNPPGNPPNWDSTSATTGIAAIQVILRVWDPKTNQTRQVTIVQDM